LRHYDPSTTAATCTNTHAAASAYTTPCAYSITGTTSPT
jgi:hypothetical protein